MSTLTPTVKLNSFAMSKQVAPIYTEESCEKKNKGDLLFLFSLKYEEFVVEGSGKTKQMAKHAAAQNMIEKLTVKYPTSDYFKEKTVFTIEDDMLKLLADKKLTPIFEYIKEEGGSENRLYTVQCTVGGLQVMGTGKGRKNARHAACREVVTHIQANKPIPKAGEKMSAPKEKPTVQEKLEGCLFKDPISVLQEYLVHNNLDPPAYSTQVVDKVYIIVCRAGSITYSASAKNKKLSKQCAAAGVLDIIGVKERPKKKPRKKPLRNNRFKFRYLPPLAGSNRHFGFEGNQLSRAKVYEPSQRAINFTRRNPDDELWLTQPRNVQTYYDMF